MTYNVFGGTLSLTQQPERSAISDIQWKILHLKLKH